MDQPGVQNENHRSLEGATIGAAMGFLGLQYWRDSFKKVDYSKALGYLETKCKNGLGTALDRQHESLIRSEGATGCWPFNFNEFNAVDSNHYMRKVLQEAKIAPVSIAGKGMNPFNKTLLCTAAAGALIGGALSYFYYQDKNRHTEKLANERASLDSQLTR